MRGRAAVRSLFVATLSVIGLATATMARAESVASSWLVQVTFPGLPASADPQAYPGRIEVSVRGEFVGCAWAAWQPISSDEVRLLPLALGYAVTGRREDVRVEAFGELNRLGRMAIRISPLAGPVPGLQNPR